MVVAMMLLQRLAAVCVGGGIQECAHAMSHGELRAASHQFECFELGRGLSSLQGGALTHQKRCSRWCRAEWL